MKTEWKILALLVLLHVLVYAVFIGESWVVESLTKENQMSQALLGEELSTHANTRAKDWFTSHFVDTRIIANSYALFIPTTAQSEQSKGMETLGEPFFVWFEQRLRLMWALVWQSYVRISRAALWAPYMLPLLVPWLIDGVVQRRIKQTNFDFTSPTRYSASYHLIGLLAIVFFMMLFSPFPMPAYLAPLFMVAVCFAAGLLSANVHKRI